MTSPKDQPLTGKRVLLAEDEAILAFNTVCLLKDAGASVLGPAKTLTETLALVKSAVLSCALLDVNLRMETVFPAAQLLRHRCVRIVFYTAYGETERLQREWPEAWVLAKPVPPGLLIRTVVEACTGIGLYTVLGPALL